MSKKYYWLKLDRGFFKRHDIKIIESREPNGREYAYFYLKLLVESIDHEGNLRFNEFIPYDAEMLATITNTPIDTVRVAINVLSDLGMISVLEDGTIYMSKVQDMIGSETEWAKKKRDYRSGIETIVDEEPIQIEDKTPSDEWFMKSQEIWEKTFDLYPKKVAEHKARYEWEKIVDVKMNMEDKLEATRIIYKAIRLYVEEYKKENPDDTSFKYMPKFEIWLVDHLPIYEKRIRNAES